MPCPYQEQQDTNPLTIESLRCTREHHHTSLLNLLDPLILKLLQLLDDLLDLATMKVQDIEQLLLQALLHGRISLPWIPTIQTDSTLYSMECRKIIEGKLQPSGKNLKIQKLFVALSCDANEY